MILFAYFSPLPDRHHLPDCVQRQFKGFYQTTNMVSWCFINEPIALPTILMQSSKNKKNVSICHGQNCRDVGGKLLTDKLTALDIDFKIIPCQSLCSYAPTAKSGDVAILHANIEKLLDT